MAYYQGVTSNFLGLRLALEAAIADNGWVESGGFFTKAGTLVRFVSSDGGDTRTQKLSVQVGNSPSDLSPISPFIIPPLGKTVSDLDAWEWPVDYHIHILTDPNEVYLVVQYGAFIQSLSFGRSPSPGNGGTGNWAHATAYQVSGTPTIRVNHCKITPDGAGCSTITSPAQRINSIPFFVNSITIGYGQPSSSIIHGAIDKTGVAVWSDPMEYLLQGNNYLGVESGTPQVPLLRQLPNNWNGETVLIPCQVFQRREEKKVSMIGELSHLRMTRNDYMPDGQVITLGADRWKVYSAYRRDTSQRDGLNVATDHSGTVAFAIRYDGP